MKYIKRIALLLFLLLAWCPREKAEAAAIMNPCEMSMYDSVRERLRGLIPFEEHFTYAICTQDRDSFANRRYFLFDVKPKFTSYSGILRSSDSYNGKMLILVVNRDNVIVNCEYRASANSSYAFEVSGNYGTYYIGSTFDIGISGYECENFFLGPPKPTTTVTLNVNGEEYTITESFEYYFLSYSADSVRLYFFDEAPSATYYDMYNFNIATGPQMVVGYVWDSKHSDFLGSRWSTGLGEAIVHPISSDYATNCDIYFWQSNDIALSSKILNPTYSSVLSALTEEMKACTDYIIYRYLSPSASTNDYIFLGHIGEKLDYFLLLNDGSRVIPVLNHERVRHNLIVGYFDSFKGEWVIEPSNIIGIGGSSEFVVPEILYSTTYLYQQRYSGETDLRPGLSYYSPVLNNTSPDSGSDDESDGALDDEITGIKWVDNILFGIADLFSSLFVPRKSFLESKINSLTSRFSFWASMTATVESFVSFLKRTDFTEPPVLMLDLSAANSSINYGLSACALDFTWYEPYKENVDVILSAILWLTFIWNSFRNLPNIINGTGGSFASTGVNGDKAERKGGK